MIAAQDDARTCDLDSALADSCGLAAAAANATPQANNMDNGPVWRAMERIVTINTSADTGHAANRGRGPIGDYRAVCARLPNSRNLRGTVASEDLIPY